MTNYVSPMKFLLLFVLVIVARGEDGGRPRLLEIAVTKNLKEGDEVRLSCDIKEGRYPIVFDWFLNHRKLDSSSGDIVIKHRDDESRLIIKSLSIEHLGEVKCVATNELGSHSQSVNLFFNGSPKPVIHWTYLDRKDSKVQSEFDTNVLSLNLTKQTTGRYKCTGSNKLGVLEKTITLSYYVV